MPLTHPLNPWQKMVLQDYIDNPDNSMEENPDDIAAAMAGDNLINFVMVELDETEDCVDIHEALRRMEVIEADILGWSKTLRFAVAVQGDNENDQAT